MKRKGPKAVSEHWCYTCGKQLKSGREIAARVITAHKDLTWCFSCWDSNPAAVEQYRVEGLTID